MMRTLSKSNKEKTDWWIIYFIMLGIIQALWTNTSTFPPLPSRLMMIVAVFLPLFVKKELVLFVFPFFMILRGQLSTAFQYLPDIHSYLFYIALLVMLLCVHSKSLNFKICKYCAPLIILCIICYTVDVLGVQDIGKYVIHISLLLFLSLFVKTKKDVDLLALSLILVCTILAMYYLVMYDQFLDTINLDDDIERSGWNDPNYFSTLLGTGFVIAILYIFRYVSGTSIFFSRKLLVAFCFVIYAAIILTASRAGFISVTLLLIVVLFRARVRFSVILLSLVIMLFAISLLLKYGLFDTLLYRFFEQGNLDTGGGRTNIWLKVFDNYSMQPFANQLFGGGYWHRAVLSEGAEAHNEFIAILADYGIVGFLVFVSVVISLFSFNLNFINAGNLASLYYVLSILSLSPFQYINICFYILWILGFKYISQTLAIENDKFAQMQG